MNLRASARKQTQPQIALSRSLKDGAPATDGLLAKSKFVSYLLHFLCFAAVLTFGSIFFVQNSPSFLIYTKDIAPMLAANTANAIPSMFNDNEDTNQQPATFANLKIPDHLKLEGTFKRQWMILPEFNLMFCTIAKSGSSSLRKFGKAVSFCKKNNPQLCHRPIDYRLSDEDLVSILKNDTWTKAIFFRDPIDRFISAYKDKCIKREDRHCKHLSEDETPLPIDEYVKAMTDPNEHSWEPDSHWAPQTDMCGRLANVIVFFDIIGLLTHDKQETYTQMKKVLQFQHFQISPKLHKALRQVFSPSQEASNEGQHVELKLQESSVQLLREFYKKDYELLSSLPQISTSTTELRTHLQAIS